MRHHIGAVITVAVIVAAAMVSERPATGQAPQGGQAGQAGAGRQGGRGTAASPPLEDRRPPLFLRETFPMPKKEEIYISQTNISDPNVELKLYGQTLPQWQALSHAEARKSGKHGGLEMVWRESPKDDPTFVFFGPCNTPCALALRHKTTFVDLTDLAKIRWRTKQTGYHQLQPIIKTADGKWYLGDYMEGPSTDWLEREFSIIDVRWKEFDEQYVTTKGTGSYVPTPDLSKVDEIGFASLAAGAVGNGGHGSSSAARVDWIEVYGRPVPR
jgi:hypothetical protein